MTHGKPLLDEPAIRCSAPNAPPSRSSIAWPAAGAVGRDSTATSTRAEDAQAFYDELAYMLRAPDGRAQLAAVVQHRAQLRLRHHRPGPGALLRRPEDRRGARAKDAYTHPPAARVLHPVGRDDLVGEGGIMDLVGPRGAPLQIRLRHRHQLLEAPRRGRTALRRRHSLRPDELPARSATAPPARSRAAAPPAAPPRWSASIWITPTSSSSSTGRPE